MALFQTDFFDIVTIHNDEISNVEDVLDCVDVFCT